MSWIYYLLEANLYLIIFYGFYRLWLYKETFYSLNRYYLIITSLVAFTIPFLQLGFLSKQNPKTETLNIQLVTVKESFFNLDNSLLIIYVIVAAIFIFKLFWGFRHILKLLNKPNKIVENGVTIVQLEHSKMAFSFFNLLFIDPDLPQKTTILRHEMVHINQKHSFDVLFFELIKSLSWFNPITYLLNNDIKLLHEYLADEETTNEGIEKYEYALFLIQNSSQDIEVQLTNQIFNSSILKRRISMLNQKKSAKWARLKLLVVLPAVGVMLCASTMAFKKDYGVVDLYPKKSIETLVIQQDTIKREKAKEIVIVPNPYNKAKKLKGTKLAPPPPPPVAPPITKKAKGVSVAPPPPPPVEQLKIKKIKGLKLAPPPPPIEPAPKKASGKDDVVYGEVIPEPIAAHKPRT